MGKTYLTSESLAQVALRILALATALLLATACSREPAQDSPQASEPVAAVHALANHLQANDLRAFARAAVPPAEHARLAEAWRSGHSRWPLTELPLDDQLSPLLLALAAPDAERQLQQAFNSNLARQHRDLREAARALGLFGASWIARDGAYTGEQRQHYAQVVQAMSRWAQQAPLGDPALGAAAIDTLAAAARATGLTTEESMREAGMEETLGRLSPFVAGARAVLAGYGLDFNASHAALRVALVEQDGERARVRIAYPVASTQVDTVLSLERRGGQWYLAGYLREAERVLASAARAPAAAGLAVPGEAGEGGEGGEDATGNGTAAEAENPR